MAPEVRGGWMGDRQVRGQRPIVTRPGEATQGSERNDPCACGSGSISMTRVAVLTIKSMRYATARVRVVQTASELSGTVAISGASRSAPEPQVIRDSRISAQAAPPIAFDLTRR